MKKYLVTILIGIILLAASAVKVYAQNAPADIAYRDCKAGVGKSTTLEKSERFVNCMVAHPNASQYTGDDRLYLARQLEDNARVRAGEISFAQMMAAQRAWRLRQLAEMDRRDSQAAYQQQMIQSQNNIANEIGMLPGRQAQWAVTIHNMNAMGRGYYPYRNRY